ncbi:MAG TPA: hypothetical protein VIF62_08230 [Labilithrix sp.]
MKRASRLLVLAAALAIATPAVAQNAAEKETARTLFEKGKKQRDKGDKEGALESFKGADAIMKVPTTKLAVARAYATLGKLTEAREAALQVALIPVTPKEPQPFTDARTSAKQLADELAGKIPQITITLVGAPKAGETKVKVDGENVPIEALSAPWKVNPGKHVLVASLRGGEVTAEAIVAEKETKAVSLDVTELAKRPDPDAVAAAEPKDKPLTEPPQEDKPGKRSVLIWIGLGVAVVGVGVGSTAGILSMGKKSDLDSQCRDGKCPPNAHDTLDSASSLATISTVGFIGAGVGLALAGVGFALGRSAPKKGTIVVQPVVGVGGGGFVGAF